jgi:hypothetical protein
MAYNHNPEVLKKLRMNSAVGQIMKGNALTHVYQADFSDFNPTFVGTFVFHKPSVMEQMDIGVVKAQLLDGMTVVDRMSDNIATMVATLDIVIDEAPQWFNPYTGDLDYDIVEDVYLNFMEWLSSFRRRSTGVADGGDSKELSSNPSLDSDEGVQGTTDRTEV